MFGTKHSKTNRLQKTIEYKTNEQSTKHSNWNMQIEIWPGKVSTSETVTQMSSIKYVFLEIPRNSQENTYARVSFLIKLGGPSTGAFLWTLQNV